MLGRGDREAGELRKKEPFKDLYGGTEEGDGAITGAKAWLFARLQNWDYGGVLPNGGDIGMVIGEVEEVGKVL